MVTPKEQGCHQIGGHTVESVANKSNTKNGNVVWGCFPFKQQKSASRFPYSHHSTIALYHRLYWHLVTTFMNLCVFLSTIQQSHFFCTNNHLGQHRQCCRMHQTILYLQPHCICQQGILPISSVDNDFNHCSFVKIGLPFSSNSPFPWHCSHKISASPKGSLTK